MPHSKEATPNNKPLDIGERGLIPILERGAVETPDAES
jgi:hypothetical protein